MDIFKLDHRQDVTSNEMKGFHARGDDVRQLSTLFPSASSLEKTSVYLLDDMHCVWVSVAALYMYTNMYIQTTD